MIIDIFTDGSCYYKSGNGGWAAIVVLRKRALDLDDLSRDMIGYQSGDTMKIISAGQRDTTTNQMELHGVLAALRFAHKTRMKRADDLHMRIFTDSSYSKHSITKWYRAHLRNGWQNSLGEPVKNQKLIRTARGLLNDIDDCTTIHKVKGHVGHHYNEIADHNAGLERKKLEV